MSPSKNLPESPSNQPSEISQRLTNERHKSAERNSNPTSAFLSGNDLSDVADAITAALRAAGFKRDHARVILAALAEADGRTAEFAVFFASLGSRMKNRLDPFAIDDELKRRGKADAQRWRRALERLEADQEAMGFCFVTCKRGGCDREGHNRPSRMWVDVETFVEIVRRARERDDFLTSRKYAFEEAARVTLQSKNKRTIKRLPPQTLSEEEKLLRLEKTGVNAFRKLAEKASAEGYDLESLEQQVIEKVRLAFHQAAEGFQFDTSLQPTEETGEGLQFDTPLPAVEADTLVVEGVSNLSGQAEDHPPAVSLEEERDTRGGIEEALATVEAFASVGADSFTTTVRDEVSEAGEAATYTGAELRERLPLLLERNEAAEESLIIRPRGAALIQVDDLNGASAQWLKPFAFLIAETSAGSYQAWLSIDAAASLPDVRSRLLKEVGGDTGANGAMRLPGSLNRKPKHRRLDGSYPRVKLVHVELGRSVAAVELEAARILAARAPELTQRETSQRPRNQSARVFPSYEKCLAAKGGNRSKADASFLRICHLRGFGMSESEAELRRVAYRPKLHRANYIGKTRSFVVR
jgi:hypothetical protein